MPGGQSSTTNSTSVADKTPWAPAIPGLTQTLNTAQSLYNSGVGSQVYGGQRIADFSNDQSAGIQSTRDQAAADNAGGIGTAYLQGVTQSNGISPTTQQGLSMLAGVPNVDTSKLGALADRIADPNNPINSTAVSLMNGSRDLTTQPQLQDLYRQSQLPSFTEQNLADVAAGKYLDPTTNPFVQAFVQSSNQNAANAVKEAYAASGRYGSGNFAGATTKAINDTDTALYANQYNTERQNQASANTAMDAARNARLGLGENITNDISNVQNTNNQTRLAGAGLAQGQQSAEAGVRGQVLSGDEFNSNLGVTKANGFISAGQAGTSAANQAAGLLPSVDALRYAPASNLLQVGGLQQQQAQQNLEAAQQYFQDQQQTPWQALSQFAAFPTAIGSQGGTSVTQGTQKTETSGPSALQSILGLGTSLLGLGTGMGGTLGGTALKSLFASDERLKEDVRPVGELDDGQKVYSYRYKGDDRTQIGLLAHEVAEKRPDAVGLIGLGDLMGVDYGKATDDAARLAAKDGKKGGGGSSGGSAPPAAPPAGRPGVTIMVEGRSPHDPQAMALSQGLGAFAASMMAGGAQAGAGGGLGLMQALMRDATPQEPAPVRTSATKPQTRGKRRAAA
jgi:hypothetical protein